ncbi:hypothetical protein PEBR_19781 [Penicillium brasilianum]|uniref:Cytochrome P450 n=1 Tax=Penicillium brasilianum TaxID=104259 RepID=A0A1S9RMU4_PENBI|nr:hypothetical protein PEBR_19781 [Penicillium brasilianum]
MHQKYGDIVRLAPEELSFSYPDAQEQIMGHKKVDWEEMGKAPCFYRTFKYEALNIINEDRVEDLASNAQIFIGAGAESTATLLMGVAYLLLKHDHVYD